MRKDVAKKIVDVLPDSIKNIASYLKNNFDKSGQDTLDNATGTVGILIKLFAQSYVDKYFENMTKDKLANYGSNMYLKASFCQIQKSLQSINQTPETLDITSIFALFEDTFILSMASFKTKDILTIFTPQYHPIIKIVKERFISLLKKLHMSDTSIKTFQRHFNENISATLKETFGSDDYAKHLKEIESFVLNENEAKLLHDMYELRHIGFKDDEELCYETTFAEWKPIDKLHSSDDSFVDKTKYNELVKKEANLTSAEKLVESYFQNIDDKDALSSILFAIADFGKGKTIFLRQYASKLAKTYSETKDGYFPIYFNLRDYSTYKSSNTLGVIDNYLAIKYGIDIKDDHFRNKRYMFLIDSLDESGELTKNAIDKVIESIKSIQYLDAVKCRKNRIIITSRPFPDGLGTNLRAYNPYEIKDDQGKDIPHYISIYGFKAEQFNHWLLNSLKTYPKLPEINATGFAKELIDSLKKGKTPINIHQKLFQNDTLSLEELKRPIFSYMIFQLIINNVDFSQIGKIGIYLSFLNLLTKEAKHIDDSHYKTNLEDEITYRNILHAIASLWMYQKEQGEQGILKKSDICRVLEGKPSQEADKEILERYKKEGVTEIQFLSHSYFGEQDNNLHFQHQSFAEILLAEYYLKVFIKYALDKTLNIDEARSKLVLGEPTWQTISFLKELILLLKSTVSNEPTPTIMEKRRLLFPLMATLSHDKHNTLFSDKLYYEWFKQVKNDEIKSSITPPQKLLETWAIDKDALEKILFLAKEIIDDKTTIISSKSSPAHALFNNELTIFHNKSLSSMPTDIDKWLSLVLGNLLETNVSEKRFFNTRLSNPKNLFEMIRNWNYSRDWSAPSWATDYFIGIKIKNIHEMYFSNLNFSDIDFSYSFFHNFELGDTNLSSVSFNQCVFHNVFLSGCQLRDTTFNDINILGEYFLIGFSQIRSGIFIPKCLADCFAEMCTIKSLSKNGGYVNYGSSKTFLNFSNDHEVSSEIFNTLKGLLQFGLNKRFFTIQNIKSWFDYEREEDRETFEALIDTLKE